MYRLKLNHPKQIVIVPAIAEQKITIDEIVVKQIIDNCIDMVIATIIKNGIEIELVLWEGDDYNNVGDWTQSQANARIEELL